MINLLIIIAVCFALLSIVISTIITGITPTPSLPKAKKHSLQLAVSVSPKAIGELGAGFGTMAFAFARTFPQSKVVAYESSWVPWIFLHLRKKVQSTKNLTIIRANFYNQDLSQFDLLFTYLYPKAMISLQEKLKDMPEASLISNTFAMHGWKPDVIHKYKNTIIYLYRRKVIS